MKLELLQVGMKYKYQQLCEAFGLKPATGNTKKKHMTTFEQYLKLEKQGTWFLVVEKYGEVQERKDGRKNCTDTPSVIKEYIITDDKDVQFLHPITNEIIDGEVLSMYQSIINQVDGNTLRDLICKSIINNLFIQLSTVGQIGFKDAWFVTNAELLKCTGLISPSYDYVKRNPKRFCKETKELTEDNLDEVLDHLNVDKQWLENKTKNSLDYLAKQYHLITYTSEAYRFVMRTTRIYDGVAYTSEEVYLPTLDEIEWINKHVIPTVLRQHKNRKNEPYRKINDVFYDGKIKEFYQYWIPAYINNNLPDGWGIVTEVYKCHRIGFSKEIIQYAVNNHMRLLYHEREILDELAECCLQLNRSQITNDRNIQVKKRHEQALQGTKKCDKETRDIRSRESYIGVGFVVNRECHSNEATYTDFTNQDKQNRDILVSKVKES